MIVHPYLIDILRNHLAYLLKGKNWFVKFLTNFSLYQILLTGKSINFLHHVCHDETNVRELEAVKLAETHQGKFYRISFASNLTLGNQFFSFTIQLKLYLGKTLIRYSIEWLRLFMKRRVLLYWKFYNNDTNSLIIFRLYLVPFFILLRKLKLNKPKINNT